MLTLQKKAEFCQLLLNELKPFWDEIDIPRLISNIDWPMGFTFIFGSEEEAICKLIKGKDWAYDKREPSLRPIITTKFWWEPSGRFFYIVLPKSINLEQYQRSLFTAKAEGE